MSGGGCSSGARSRRRDALRPGGSPFRANVCAIPGHYSQPCGICQTAEPPRWTSKLSTRQPGPSVAQIRTGPEGDHLGTDTRSLTPKRVTGASPPQPPTRLGHATPHRPRTPHRRLTAAAGVVTGTAGPSRRHGASQHPAVRERPAGSAVLGSAAHRSRVEGARGRPPSWVAVTSETPVNERSLADVDSTQVPAETEGVASDCLHDLRTFAPLTKPAVTRRPGLTRQVRTERAFSAGRGPARLPARRIPRRTARDGPAISARPPRSGRHPLGRRNSRPCGAGSHATPAGVG